MDSKRGTLSVEEIVKLILGVAVFIFILFILFGVYNIVSGSLKEQQAKIALENIIYEIKNLSDGDSKEVLIESPKGWALVGRGKKVCYCAPQSSMYPLKTDVGTSTNYLDNNLKVCEKYGVCQIIEDEALFSSLLNTCMPSGVTLKKLSDSYLKYIPDCIYVSQVPFILVISRVGKTISFAQKNGKEGVPVSGWGNQNSNCEITGLGTATSVIPTGSKFVIPSVVLDFENCNLGLLSDSKVNFFLKCDSSVGGSEMKYPGSISENSCKLGEISQENNFANFTSCEFSTSVLGDKSSAICSIGVDISWIGTNDVEKNSAGVWVDRVTKSDFANLELYVEPSSAKCEIYSVRYDSMTPQTNYYFSFETNCSLNEFGAYLKTLGEEELSRKENYLSCTSDSMNEWTNLAYSELDTGEEIEKVGDHYFIQVAYPFPVDSKMVCSEFIFHYSGKQSEVNIS